MPPDPRKIQPLKNAESYGHHAASISAAIVGMPGRGEFFIGQYDVTTDALGNATINRTFMTGVGDDEQITATAKARTGLRAPRVAA